MGTRKDCDPLRYANVWKKNNFHPLSLKHAIYFIKKNN